MKRRNWRVGVARTNITPFPGVELAGLGYFLKRTWNRIHDDLHATAFVISDEEDQSVALLALDLLYADVEYVQAIREQCALRTGLHRDAICVNCSHSHNAPTLAFFDGAGEINPKYANKVVAAAAEAVETAWRNRQPARLQVGFHPLSGVTYNRTREGGAVDDHLGILRADSLEGRPIAIAVNFHAHPTVFWQVEPSSVSRDCPGRMVDRIEQALPGVIGLYLQGSCGDVNFNLAYWTRERHTEAGDLMFEAAMEASARSREIEPGAVRAVSHSGMLPVRAWRREEVMDMYLEGKHRLETGDTSGWLEGIASRMVGLPARLPERYGGSVERAVEAVSRFAVRWGESVLPELDQPPKMRSAEFQAMRFGDFWMITNPTELFTSLALEIRRCWPHRDLFILGYSNGALSYLPDREEVERGSYASLHVPKAVRACPFTRDAGATAVRESLAALRESEH
jgi:neutral ceramidase